MVRRPNGVWQTFQPSQLPVGAWASDASVNLCSAVDGLLRALPGVTLAVGISQLDSLFHVRPADTDRVRTQDYIQTAWVPIDENFATYWEARGKNLRQNTRKQRNKLQVEGLTTRLECVTKAEDVSAAIDNYGILESAGWKATEGTAIQRDNAQGRFYKKMFENYCAAGRGRIYRYRFGDKIVAMDLCIEDASAIVILKTAYDESYKSLSPSTLMRQEQFESLFEERRYKHIEFYGKVMEWHTRWTDESRCIYHLTSYRWKWLKQLHSVISGPASKTHAALTVPTTND